MQKIALGLAAILLIVGVFLFINRDLDFSTSIPAQTFHEVVLKLENGQSVEWEWKAAKTVRFDLHSHAGASGPATEHVVVEKRKHSGSFGAVNATFYSLVWANPGSSAINLQYTVETTGWLVEKRDMAIPATPTDTPVTSSSPSP